MYVLKGFMIIQQLVNNLAGNVSLVGELSPMSLTYSKEIGYYEIPEVGGYKLATFSNKNGGGYEVYTDQQIAYEAVRVIRDTYVYYKVYGGLIDSNDLRDTIISNNPTTSNINFGELVNTPVVSLPEWVSWESTIKSGYLVKIWLSDNAFTEQYDEFEIVVVPALKKIDDFFQPPANVKTLLGAKTITDYLLEIESSKSERPETYLRSINSQYASTTLPQVLLDTNWSVLIYGPAGDNIDAIKDAIRNYILDNTKFTELEWKKIFPDLFSRIEFVFVPRWDKLAISNISTLLGIYSSISDPNEVISFVDKQIDYYRLDHINNYLRVIPYPYRSVMIAVIPGTDNIPLGKLFETMYPDYLPVTSTSIDFNRMTQTTVRFLTYFERMVMISENLTDFTNLPKEYRRVKRDGKIYISMLLDGVQYLVMSRNSFTGV